MFYQGLFGFGPAWSKLAVVHSPQPPSPPQMLVCSCTGSLGGCWERVSIPVKCVLYGSQMCVLWCSVGTE
jgi:hypothetical protein